MYAILIPQEVRKIDEKVRSLPMRVVIQRVSQASVKVDGEICGQIGAGLLVLLGVEHSDTPKEADYLAGKTAGLRIFCDDAGRMNLSVRDTGGSVLVVSQFTLYGDCAKGMRPSFDRAARPEQARGLYDHYVGKLRESGLCVETGVFQADMEVSLVNDGPVTIICDSKPL